MKAAYSQNALSDLDELLDYTARHFPFQKEKREKRIRSAVARIEAWPESARRVAGRPGVRVVPLLRYPFRIFYSYDGTQLVILHIHHAGREAP